MCKARYEAMGSVEVSCHQNYLERFKMVHYDDGCFNILSYSLSCSGKDITT